VGAPARRGRRALGLLAYYTRHRIPDGHDGLFFFNAVAGPGTGDSRAYRAWVRVVGPGGIVSARRLDLSQWRFAMPLSLSLAGSGESAATLGLEGGLATGDLTSAGMVAALLESPRPFLNSYRSPRWQAREPAAEGGRRSVD
jgi:hypothetical protein